MAGQLFSNPWALPIFSRPNEPAPLVVAQNVLPPIFAQHQRQDDLDNVHIIKPGPEYNKWDEALREHGRILLPKELDEPQVWLNQPHIEQFLRDYHREDRPDGSVILSRIVPMS